MGKYIEQDSKGKFIGKFFKHKVENLVADGAIKIDAPTEFQENLVCVIDNFLFAAAGYVFDEREMEDFIIAAKGRNHQWLIYKHAKELTK